MHRGSSLPGGDSDSAPISPSPRARASRADFSVPAPRASGGSSGPAVNVSRVAEIAARINQNIVQEQRLSTLTPPVRKSSLSPGSASLPPRGPLAVPSSAADSAWGSGRLSASVRSVVPLGPHGAHGHGHGGSSQSSSAANSVPSTPPDSGRAHVSELSVPALGAAAVSRGGERADRSPVSDVDEHAEWSTVGRAPRKGTKEVLAAAPVAQSSGKRKPKA